MRNPLVRLSDLGQSIWYDDLGREMLSSGKLKSLIEQDAVTGVTSNPSIFQKSISREKTYDHDLHLLVDKGLDVYGIYEGLAIEDIRQAADLLAPVFDKTDGMDGYVSLEVAPDLAYNVEKTVAQASHLFELVDRKNVMIKVPGTPEGAIAVKTLIAKGVNINVTLLFSLEQYQAAAQAYMEGLEEFTAAGGDPKRVASVASFFVSRVDTMVDELLMESTDPQYRNEARELMGKAAIANAKLAYATYKELFQGERFASLRDGGARPQRLLWASTSTKNPNYPDVYYVENLVGQGTVNTMPAATLEAYRDHGDPAVRIEEGQEDAKGLFPKLAEMGIDIDHVMGRLLLNGVKSFADSFDDLLKSIETKRSRLLRGWGHRSASLGPILKDVEETLSRCDRDKIGEKIWACEPSVWKDDPSHQKEIVKRLGWLTVVETMKLESKGLMEFAEEIKSEGITDVALLGMGGSSLAAEVFYECFGSAEGYPKLIVLDTTVPKTILDAERQLDLRKTLFLVSSKSGSTIESMSLFKHFWDRVEQADPGQAGRHFIAITDPGTSLGKLASERSFRKAFLNPPDIGGRFSALSYFGLVPAALIGADVDRILMRAAQAVESTAPRVPALENAGLWLGVIMATAAMVGMDKLTLLISPEVNSLGGWLEQLIAESTGKEGKGIVPVSLEPVGSPDSYSKDRLLVYLRMDNDGAYDQFVGAMESAGYPVITMRLHAPYDLGREMFRWEFATACAGAILGINPFDQPNVQESKDLTKRLLELHSIEGQIPEGELHQIEEAGLTDTLKEFLAKAQSGDYIAVNAFVSPNPESEKALQEFRARLREKYRVATALGFGPRYLHSTGQLHKGGPDKGLFILVTCDDAEDVAIPGEAYSFGVLKSAQSLGDYEALKKRGRRILRLHLKSESQLAMLSGLLA